MKCKKHPKTDLICPACVRSINSPAQQEASRKNGKKNKGKEQ